VCIYIVHTNVYVGDTLVGEHIMNTSMEHDTFHIQLVIIDEYFCLFTFEKRKKIYIFLLLLINYFIVQMN
jgi:hypothetical protein